MMASRRAEYAEESAEVEVLYANLEKLKALTRKIQATNDRVETSGKTINDHLAPVYSSTQKPYTTINNINKINEAINRMRKPLDSKMREEEIIRAGPQAAGLPKYISAIQRVGRALNEMEATNLRSNQEAISEYSGLLQTGSRQLEDIFRSMLEEEAKFPIEPMTYVTKNKPFPMLDSEKLFELRTLASAIDGAREQETRRNNQGSPVVQMYVDVRGPYLTNSLQTGSMASINTAKRKPTDGPYKQDTNGIKWYAQSVEGIFLAEYENINSIFPASEAGRAFEATCQPSLAEFSRTIRDLNTYIKSNLMLECFLAFDIIDKVTALCYRLEKETGELKSIFLEALRPARETAKTSLFEILEDAKRRVTGLAVLPLDGASVAPVQEIMDSLGALVLYSTSLSSILTSIGDGNWKRGNVQASNPALDVGADGPTLIAHYMLDVIEALMNALDTRAKGFHRTKAAHGVFIANAMSVVERSIRGNPDLGQYLQVAPHNARLDPWRKKGTQLYLDSWRDCTSYLFDVQYTSRNSARPTSGTAVDSAAIVKGLSSKDKDNIKDKFKAFNASFDEAVNRHKSLHMEKDVKTTLAKEVQATLEPLYARFWDRYHEVDKGKGKYAKYDKSSLNSVLSGLA